MITRKTLGALALASAFALGLAPSVAAAEAACGTPAAKAVYSTVTTPATAPVYKQVKVVDVVARPAIPAVTEQVKVIDVEAKPAVPAKPGSPAVEEVGHYEKVLVKPAYDEVVVVKPAYDEVVAGRWWNFSPNKSRKPFNGPPAFPTDPRGTWQGPHTNGGPSKDKVGTFQQGKGHGSWFHREASRVVHHPAVTKVVHHKAVYKKVWVVDVEAKPAVPATPAIPAVQEVSHFETRVVTPAVPAVQEVSHFNTVLVKPGAPASSKTVLVSKAKAATEPCATKKAVPKKASHDDDVLAYTGSDAQNIGISALILIAVSGLFYLLRRRLTQPSA